MISLRTSPWEAIRELKNRRLLHDDAVRLRDMLTAHAFLSTCQLRPKGDDVGESDFPASWKLEDVIIKMFEREKPITNISLTFLRVANKFDIIVV